MVLHWKLAIGNEIAETKHAVCPHCKKDAEFRTFELLSSFLSIPLPKSKIYACNECSGLSRQENKLSRIVNVVFVLPAMLIASIGFVVGAIGIPYSLMKGTFDASIGAVLLVLAVVSLLLLGKMLKFVRRNLDADQLLPSNRGLNTEI
jgi:hypothetical protein